MNERKEWVGRRSSVALGTYCDECRGYIKEGLKRFCNSCYEHASESSGESYAELALPSLRREMQKLREELAVANETIKMLWGDIEGLRIESNG